LRKQVSERIETEWARTAKALTLITGHKERLATNPGVTSLH